MDKVGSASSSLTEVQHHQCINVVHDIQEKLEKLEPPVSVECCIYKVPDYLRKSKGEHYTPQIISIGPFHQNNPKLETMEHHKNPMFQTMEQRKLRYLKYFMQRAYCLEGLVSTIKDCEESVRHFYAETIHLGSDEFVKIILVDAIFILELFWRYNYNDWTSDDNGATLEPWLTSAIRSDLILLENQLPFFVLEKLFNVALKHDPQYSSLLFQVITFVYFQFYNTQNIAPKRDFKIKHFLDLLRTFWLPHPYQNLPKGNRTAAVKHLYTATQLHEAGLVFKPVSSRSCLFDIKFRKGVLEMPPLTLDNSSESLYRNLLALEQCHYPNEAYITDYFILLGFLISTSKDVNLLVRKGVVVNLLANKDAAKTLVNNLVTNIIYADMNNVYSEACNGLKAFYDKPWHSWKATLRREYFSTPWRIVSTIAAVILLVLTLLQTAYTMK